MGTRGDAGTTWPKRRIVQLNFDVYIKNDYRKIIDDIRTDRPDKRKKE